VIQKQSKGEKKTPLYLYLKTTSHSKYPENKKITVCGSGALYFSFYCF